MWNSLSMLQILPMSLLLKQDTFNYTKVHQIKKVYKHNKLDMKLYSVIVKYTKMLIIKTMYIYLFNTNCI